jgi:hypothetical protein
MLIPMRNCNRARRIDRFEQICGDIAPPNVVECSVRHIAHFPAREKADNSATRSQSKLFGLTAEVSQSAYFDSGRFEKMGELGLL